MPVMRWNEFNEAHHRPYVVFADIGGSSSPQLGFDRLRRLVVAMTPKGNVSLFPETSFLRVAFELDTDAEQFAAGVRAKRTAREVGWVEQWSFRFDPKTAKVESPLKLAQRTAQPRASAGGRKRRQTPF
jgi:hypothetical protein